MSEAPTGTAKPARERREIPLVADRKASEPEQALAAALRAWAGGFDFEQGAVLVNVPQVPFDLLEREVAQNRGYFAYPPHALLYLSACFRSLGIASQVIDLNYIVLRALQEGVTDLGAEWQRRLGEALSAFERPLVCVSFMFEATRPAFEAVCAFVRAARPGACLAVGGVNATADPDSVLAAGLADVVFLNEGEQSLGGFYAYLRGEASGVPPNLVWRGPDGLVHRSDLVSGGPVDLDIRREYEEIPIGDYHKAGSISNFSRMNGLEVPFSPVLAKRGCRARCAFCGVRYFNGRGVRLREPEDVVEEMLHLRGRYGIEHFDWLDDDLLYDKRASLRLFQLIEERLPGITWAANNGLIASAITDELFAAMARSGCIGFKVGLESGNPEMLKRVHKPTNVSQFLEFARLAQRYPQVFVSINFILGLPEERFEQMRDSLELAVRSRSHWHNFYIYQHLKNTEFYIAYGGLGDAWSVREHGKDSQSPLFQPPPTSPAARDVNLNPVRGGRFRDYRPEEAPGGYDVFGIEPGLVPPRAWVREVWFTFNSLANFILNPAVSTESEVLLLAMIRWLDVLGRAYPQDASMACLRYHLERRAARGSAAALEALRERARTLLADDYWRLRDAQFGFSAFLEGAAPPLPPALSHLSALQRDGLAP